MKRRKTETIRVRLAGGLVGIVQNLSPWWRWELPDGSVGCLFPSRGAAIEAMRARNAEVIREQRRVARQDAIVKGAALIF